MLNKADRIRRMNLPPAFSDPALADRLPPGQVWTERFPILHEGQVPQYDMNTWNLRITGEVEEERVFSYQDIMNLPQTTIQTDIHCVTRWSKVDTVWEGIRFRDLCKLFHIKQEATHVMIHAAEDYQTNVPLIDLMGDKVLLAHSYDGKPLTPKHGWPLRLLVPHLYFWKSAKWIRSIEFLNEEKLGFWEQNGFHSQADPMKEQRFSGEELVMTDEEWLKKEHD